MRSVKVIKRSLEHGLGYCPCQDFACLSKPNVKFHLREKKAEFPSLFYPQFPVQDSAITVAS